MEQGKIPMDSSTAPSQLRNASGDMRGMKAQMSITLLSSLFLYLQRSRVKETGWGVMKEGKEKKREGKGGTARGREGGKEATNALQRLTQSKFT